MLNAAVRSSKYTIGDYLRISQEDSADIESNSIRNQREMIRQYIAEHDEFHGATVTDYVDDGISGTTFERSGFKQMIDDIENGKVNLVITKDLSRLGRDYLKTGYYTEVFFPENNVRYIALNDGIDTINNDNDIAPFKTY